MQKIQHAVQKCGYWWDVEEWKDWWNFWYISSREEIFDQRNFQRHVSTLHEDVYVPEMNYQL